MDFKDLSKREREVVDLASSGLTDEGIARELGISTATVNTYWGRVRSKLGQLSRTEIVAAVVRNDQFQEIEKLRTAYQEALKTCVVGGFRMRELVEFAPQAVLILDSEGTILFASEEAYLLFGYEQGELEGQSHEILIPSALRDVHKAHVDDYLKDPVRRQMTHLEAPGRKKDGSEIDIAVDLRGVERDGLAVIICIARLVEPPLRMPILSEEPAPREHPEHLSRAHAEPA
jgi:PAS domain S-box-containing protein